jgi:hypothetical protein
MAFGTSSAKPVFTRRTGIGVAKIVAVNPTMKQINDAFGRDVYTSEPEYLHEVEYDGKKYTMSRVTFLLKFNAEDNNGYDDFHFLTLPITNRIVANADNSKVQVIDEFGRTAWVTTQEFKSKSIPVYSNGPARITNNYHACLRGEENLVNFISTFLCTPNIDVYNKTTGEWQINTRDSADDCKKEIPTEDMKKIIAGNVSPIRDYIKDEMDNKVKVLIGVRTDTNDGRKYPVIYDRMFMNQYQTKTTMLERSLAEDLARGRFANTVFKIGPLVDVDTVSPDDLSKPVSVPTATTPAKKDDFDPLGDLPF